MDNHKLTNTHANISNTRNSRDRDRDERDEYETVSRSSRYRGESGGTADSLQQKYFEDSVVHQDFFKRFGDIIDNDMLLNFSSEKESVIELQMLKDETVKDTKEKHF